MSHSIRLLRLSTIIVVAVPSAFGCSSSPNGSAGPGGNAGSGGAGGSGGAPGSADTVVGGFSVRLVPAVPETNSPAYTSVLGRVDNGSTPSGVIMEVVDEANGCRLRTPRVPFCSPACGVDAVCVDDNKCLPYPKAQNLGVIKARGLGNAEFSMELIGSNYQPPGDITVPNPPCPEGADVTIQTGGGAYPPFVLTGKGITALTVAGSGPIPLNADQPLKLKWTPPGAASVTRIQVRVDISHHGGLKGEIECDVPDSGALEIPGIMVGKLIALGTAGFPTVYVTRASISGAAIHPGRVTLNISSSVERPLQIAGLISCNTDSDCPAGKPCLPDYTCTR